jgi:hypothetical protein
LRQKKKTFERQQQEEAEQLVFEAAGNEVVPKKRKGRPTVLDQEKIDKLESVGFKWYFDRSHNKTWEERYQDLIVFKSEHGHCNVPRKEGTFGEWVSVSFVYVAIYYILSYIILHSRSTNSERCTKVKKRTL